jgi:hypothetical protein
MRTPVQIISDTLRDAKTTPGVVALTLVVVQMLEGKIADFNLVFLTSEAAAVAQLTELVNAGWTAIGVYIVTASSGAAAQRVSSGPLREFVGDRQVEKFLTALVDRSSLYCKDIEGIDWSRIRRINWGRDRKKPPRFSA